MRYIYLTISSLLLFAAVSTWYMGRWMWDNTIGRPSEEPAMRYECAEDTFSIRDFVLELHIQEVRHPDIVLRQACLESAWFTSPAWRKNHNPFGFRYNGEYILFNDWKSAIGYMKSWQDKYYKGGDYYLFLERRGYAEDSCYVETLKKNGSWKFEIGQVNVELYVYTHNPDIGILTKKKNEDIQAMLLRRSDEAQARKIPGYRTSS